MTIFFWYILGRWKILEYFFFLELLTLGWFRLRKKIYHTSIEKLATLLMKLNLNLFCKKMLQFFVNTHLYHWKNLKYSLGSNGILLQVPLGLSIHYLLIIIHLLIIINSTQRSLNSKEGESTWGLVWILSRI